MSVWVVIPARYASSRLPGKPLVKLAGKPMVQRVWERAGQARNVSRVVVATDDERIRRVVEDFGGQAVMTRSDHRCGTERTAEVAAGAPRDAEIFVNVQGDEPLIEPAAIETAVDLLRNDPEVQVGTLAAPVRDPNDVMDPNVVKVVVDFEANALYFSRAPIPWIRDGMKDLPAIPHKKHLGLYVYRRAALLEFPMFPQGELEKLEQLEQLRWLENGYPIRVGETTYDSVRVDVPEDVARVEKILRESESAAGS